MTQPNNRLAPPTTAVKRQTEEDIDKDMDEDIAPPSFAGIVGGLEIPTSSNTKLRSTSPPTGSRTPKLQEEQPQTAAEATETEDSPTSEVDENTNANQSPANNPATEGDARGDGPGFPSTGHLEQP